MTTFGQDNGIGGIPVVPVPAHVTVAHVHVLDRFEVLDADEFADGPGLDRFPQFDKIRCIAQHVANGDDTPGFFSQGEDLAAFLFAGRNGFFQQNVVTCFQGGYTGAIVQVIGRADDDRVGKFRPLEHPFPGIKTLIIGDVVLFCVPLVADRDGLGYAHDIHFFRITDRKIAVHIPPVAGPEGDDGHRSGRTNETGIFFQSGYFFKVIFTRVVEPAQDGDTGSGSQGL